MITIYDRDWDIAVPLKLEMNTFLFFSSSLNCLALSCFLKSVHNCITVWKVEICKIVFASLNEKKKTLWIEVEKYANEKDSCSSLMSHTSKTRTTEFLT